ncbi:hypothetical protein AAG906_021626 [Vitis piasezkii]
MGRSPVTFKFTKGDTSKLTYTRSYLDKAAKKIKKFIKDLPILGKVGKVSYRVELPPRLKIHPVFHVSYLKPYHEDKDDPSRGFSKRSPTAVVTSYDKEVEHIIANRVIRRRGVPPTTEYLVKWKGLPETVPGKRCDEDVYGLGGGECHRMLQMSLPMGLYRAQEASRDSYT